MSDDHSRVYWKGLRLGDYRRTPETMRFITDTVQFQSAVGGAVASAWSAGANARYSASVEVAFRRGFRGSETTPTQFWNRLRNFLKDCKRAVQYGSGAPSVGALSIIRDAEGGMTGERDTTESVGALSAGSSVVVDLAQTVEWTMGQIVLIALQSDPSVYEIATIISVAGGGGSITVNLVNSYSGVADVCRIEWYWPECALASPIALDVANGPAPSNHVTGIRIDFDGVVDPVNGGLT